MMIIINTYMTYLILFNYVYSIFSKCCCLSVCKCHWPLLAVLLNSLVPRVCSHVIFRVLPAGRREGLLCNEPVQCRCDLRFRCFGAFMNLMTFVYLCAFRSCFAGECLRKNNNYRWHGAPPSPDGPNAGHFMALKDLFL